MSGGGLFGPKFKFMANSRVDEMEADRIGFKLAVGAGDDKDKVGKFYEKLLQMEKNSRKGEGTIMKNLADAISTHPPSEERVIQMNAMAANMPAIKNPVISSPDYNRAKQIAAGVRKNG